MPTIPPSVLPVLMLFASNVFMTFAWYGHLKFKTSWLPAAVLVSWGIAFFEYWLAVPANRWGNAVYTAAELKTMPEPVIRPAKGRTGWRATTLHATLRFRRAFPRRSGITPRAEWPPSAPR